MRSRESLREQIIEHCPTLQQKEAIFTESKEYLLRAAPGSGKTWTACRRFIWRGSNFEYDSGGLALLSFTNTAIKEFKDTTINLGKRELLFDPNYVGTFDSFLDRFIITPFGHLITQSTKKPRLFIAERPGDRSNNDFKIWVSSSERSQSKKQPIFAWDVVVSREHGQTIFKYVKKNKEIKLESQESRRALLNFLNSGFYTHNHRSYWSFEILKNYPKIAKVIAKSFPEIIVDEAQDTNIWFIIVLHLLREANSKITIIGDPDQCIYEFNFAESNTLEKLRSEWNLSEKHLSKSFRFNNQIASSVQYFSTNESLVGQGLTENDKYGSFILRLGDDDLSKSISLFQRILHWSKVSSFDSAILCRGISQLNRIHGETHFAKLKGNTQRLAEASFQRDIKKDFHKSYESVEKTLRYLIKDDIFWSEIDDFPETEEAQNRKLEIWKFIRSQEGLPSINLSGKDWLCLLRRRIRTLGVKLSAPPFSRINNSLTLNGLSPEEKTSPLFTTKLPSLNIRCETIHQVKGESIDAVMVLGDPRTFWTPVVKAIQQNQDSEARRIAYVAMTRARHLVVLGLPARHFDKYESTWQSWGFRVLDQHSLTPT